MYLLPCPLLAPPHSSSNVLSLSPFLRRRNNKELKSKEATLLLVNSLVVSLGKGELMTSGHAPPPAPGTVGISVN